VPRQLTFTGKATLFENVALGAFLRHMRVVPLRRAQDEATASGGTTPRIDATRNAEAFAAIHGALAQSQVVLLFPEGRSWDAPKLAPIKTGAARIALSAREQGIAGLVLVPIGINYERKDGLRSRVLVEVGHPLAVDALDAHAAQVDSLTVEIARRLHAVTLNFDDEADADEILDVSTVLASASDEVRPLGDPDAPLAAKVAIAKRADAIRDQIERGALSSDDEVRVRQVQRRLLALRRTATRLGIRLDDVALDTRLPAAGRFVVREVLLAAVGLPLAAWGRVNHILPFTLARALGARNTTAKSQFAMRTIVLGVVLIPLFYLVQTGIVWRVFGGWVALLYAASLIPSASWDLRYTERLRQLRRRSVAWRHFRLDPGLQQKLRSELGALRDEAAQLAARGAPA
jgi:glycerol-3-phosphate O-acyltransferase / dihydroxyacetone phosphate acyltransferase